jgi:hypothetical protein
VGEAPWCPSSHVAVTGNEPQLACWISRLLGEKLKNLDLLAPKTGEAAVLSALLVRDDDQWIVAFGSLLSVPREAASTSWRRWRELQPATRGRDLDRGGFDLGPNFYSDPFDGLRVLRRVVEPCDWGLIASSIVARSLPTSFGTCGVQVDEWTSIAFAGRHGSTATHRVVDGIRRPVSGISASLKSLDLPPSKSTWSLASPFYLKPGRALGRIWPERNLFAWPSELLGVDWIGGDETPPPRRFVIGRAQTDAWIADVVPVHDSEELKISIGWDEQRIDPLSCVLLIRIEKDGLPLMTRYLRISDLPERGHSAPNPEPRARSWKDRLLEVYLPRGPRRAEWGAMLLSPAGAVLDERPVVRRVEQIELSIGFKDAPGSESKSIIGDPKPPPTGAERDEAIRLSEALEEQARRAAAERRLTSGGELSKYLRWRFSCRAGELLILDPFLFEANRTALTSFLQSFDRPLRILTGSIRDPVKRLIDRTPMLDAQELPRGKNALHDRVWIVGETGLLVGNSISGLMGKQPGRITTATEMPHGDTLLWRDQFETWWGAATNGT